MPGLNESEMLCFAYVCKATRIEGWEAAGNTFYEIVCSVLGSVPFFFEGLQCLALP